MHSSLKCIILSSKLFKFPNILIFSFHDKVHIFAGDVKESCLMMLEPLGKYINEKLKF